MGVVSIVGKVVLVVINLLILLLSLALIAIGVIIIAGKDLYQSLLDSMEEDLQSSLNSAGLSSVSTEDFSFSDMMVPLAYGLIALGVVMGAISLLGCIGSCYTIKIVLLIYSLITTVIFVVQLILVILIYTDRSAFDSMAKDYIKDTLDDYSGIEGTDAKTLAWNALMTYEKCCGVDGYSDFDGLSKWPPTTIGGYAVTNLQTPIMCCKTLPNFSSTPTYACAQSGTADSTNNYLNEGCYDKLFDLIVDNAFVITTFAVLLVFQFVMIFFSVWIICTMDNKVDII